MSHRHAVWSIFLFLLVSMSACTWLQARNGQGWTRDEQHRWYRASQGSRWIPEAWLLALEEKNAEQKFLRPESIERFGYLKEAPDDTSALPIGFAIDTTEKELSFTGFDWFEGQKPGERWVGLNCSACHTAQITYKGQSIRVDGGPTMADFQSLEEELSAALTATSNDPAKWARFAAAALGTSHDNATNRAKLRTAFDGFAARQRELLALNASPSRYGPARLDAVGHILNRVAWLDGAKDQFGAPSDAPVSYPFIWNTHQHDFVQWNGIAPNHHVKLPSGEVFDYGAIGRNTGEVLGVFADVTTKKNAGLGGYDSSVSVTNLDAMETQLSWLKPPAWPREIFKAEEDPHFEELVATGEKLFHDHCEGCHNVLKRDDLKTPITAVMTPIWGDDPKHPPVGTDPWMACNAFTYRARSGNLEGTTKGYVGNGPPLEAIDFSRDLLATSIVGVLAGKKRQLADTALRAVFGLPRKPRISELEAEAVEIGQADKAERLRDCQRNAADKLLAYKGRPLTGIWATAPYLHNGSVKSLYELLLPPAKRATSFHVGNREFDPVHVGYVDAPSPNDFVFKVRDDSGNPIPGNSNEGHDYNNASLSDEQRKALVEYMKTL